MYVIEGEMGCHERLDPESSCCVGALRFGRRHACQLNQRTAGVRPREPSMSINFHAQPTFDADDRFRHLIDSAPMLIFLSDAFGNGIYFNKQWLSFTGHSAQQLAGRRWIDDVHPDDREECAGEFKSALAVRQNYSFECRLRRYDGDYHYVLNTGTPEFDPDGRFLGYIDTAVDVNSQKAAEEAFRYSEMRCRALFGPSIGNVAVIDCSARIIAVNDGWLRFARQHGSQSKIGAGANYLEVCQKAMLCDEQDAETARQGVADVLNGSRPDFHLEYRCIGKFDEWFELIVQPLRRPEGGAMITHLNITSRRKAELQTQGLLQELAHMNRVAALGELTASFAHELNQPLTAILNNAQTAKGLVRRTRKRSGIDGMLSDIIADDLRAGRIIQRLRAMLKKSSSRFRVLNLNKLVREVYELLRDDAALKKIHVSLVLDPAVSTVWGERIQLQQVILNLMVNAFEAMYAGNATIRKLTIETFMVDKGSVAILVRDSGPGVPVEQLDRVFEPFFTTKAQGLGMGLVICRSIVGAHQGEISVVNNPEGGATFRVVLPTSASGKGEP